MLAQVIREMEKFKPDLLGLCETRWPGSEELNNANRSVFLYNQANQNMNL